MTPSEESKIAVDLLCEKIDRVIKHIASCRPFTESDQRAVRLLNSRKRLYWRLHDLRYGSDEQQARAKIELNLAHQDDGETTELQGRRHVIGWLSCRACETDQKDGQPFPVSIARLCKKCKAGVQHACPVGVDTPAVPLKNPRTVMWTSQGLIEVTPNPQDMPGLSNPQPPQENQATVTPPVATQDVQSDQNPPLELKRLYCCDVCGAQDQE
jgi:hypothetical protein